MEHQILVREAKPIRATLLLTDGLMDMVKDMKGELRRMDETLTIVSRLFGLEQLDPIASRRGLQT
jgi:hypothetical protein